MPWLAALLVLAVAASVAGEPRSAKAPPPLVMTGNLSAFISLAPVAVAHITGRR